MTDPDKNAVGDMRQAFDLSGSTSAPAQLAPPRRVKVFKSGNSLAVRMPKGLGLEAGMELDLNVAGDGTIALRKAPPLRRTIDISGFAGKLPGFKPAPREDFEERPSTIAAREAVRRAAEGQ